MQIQEVKPDAFEEDIINELHKLDGFEGNNKRWTEEVKNAVGRVLKRKGYKVYASNCDEKDGTEWLYDLTGIEEKDNYLKSIPLVLESEWKSRGKWRDTEENYESNILYDFRKLLVARTEHRVMVFEAKSKEKEKEVIEQLLKHVQNCRHSAAGDRYLFACCIQVEKKWVFDYSVYVVKK